MTTETKKPSERVEAIVLAQLKAGHPAVSAANALHELRDAAICQTLDEEAERRVAWERGVVDKLVEQDQELAKLKALAKPLRYVVAPPHASKVELEKLVERVKNLGATVLPHRVDVSGPTLEQLEARGSEATRGWVPIPCSNHLPATERRVLFFVPGHEDPDRRWRVGAYTRPPLYLETEWQDEESEVGDTGIAWRLDQVTHWMPMPGEPA